MDSFELGGVGLEDGILAVLVDHMDIVAHQDRGRGEGSAEDALPLPLSGFAVPTHCGAPVHHSVEMAVHHQHGGHVDPADVFPHYLPGAIGFHRRDVILGIPPTDENALPVRHDGGHRLGGRG